MFLATNISMPDVFGVPITAIVPLIIGTLGFLGAYSLDEKHKMVKNIVAYASEELIRAGVTSFVRWVEEKLAKERWSSLVLDSFG